MEAIEFFGYASMVMICFAYLQNLRNKWSNTDNWYLALNAIGAIGILLSSYSNQAYPAVVLETFWFFFTLYSFLTRKSSEKT